MPVTSTQTQYKVLTLKVLFLSVECYVLYVCHLTHVLALNVCQWRN